MPIVVVRPIPRVMMACASLDLCRRGGNPILRIAASSLKIGTIPPKVNADMTNRDGVWVSAKWENMLGYDWWGCARLAGRADVKRAIPN